METIQRSGLVSKPEGGYCLIPVTRLYAAWWLYRQGELEFRDLRIYLALEEMRARRCTLKAGRSCWFTLAELSTLCGTGNLRSIRASLRRLQQAGLSTWNVASIEFHEENLANTRGDLVERLRRITNHRRRVPVPRRTLRWLASVTRPILVATVLGHLLRCVYLRGRAVTAEGSVSATWIGRTFDVDRRNVKRAKAKLRELKWLNDKPSRHWHRQRYGQTVAVNLSWGEGTISSKCRSTGLPPPSAPISTGLPPPDSDRELPKEIKNQKRLHGPGVREEGGGTKSKPRLSRVVPADLIEPSRTAELFHQAIRCGLVRDAAMDRLQFFAAAQRATRLGRNPGGFFTTIVRRRLWPFISDCDEQSARRKLAEIPEVLCGGNGARSSERFTARTRTSPGPVDTENPTTIRELVRQSLATAPFAVRDVSPDTDFPLPPRVGRISPAERNGVKEGNPCTHGAKALTPFRGA